MFRSFLRAPFFHHGAQQASIFSVSSVRSSPSFVSSVALTVSSVPVLDLLVAGKSSKVAPKHRKAKPAAKRTAPSSSRGLASAAAAGRSKSPRSRSSSSITTTTTTTSTSTRGPQKNQRSSQERLSRLLKLAARTTSTKALFRAPSKNKAPARPSLNLSFGAQDDDDEDRQQQHDDEFGDGDEDGQGIGGSDEALFDIEKKLSQQGGNMAPWRQVSLYGSITPASAGGIGDEGDPEPKYGADSAVQESDVSSSTNSANNESDQWSSSQLDRLGERLSSVALNSSSSRGTKNATERGRGRKSSSVAAGSRSSQKPAVVMPKRRGQNQPAPWMVPDNRPKHLDRDTERQTRTAIRSLMMYYHSCIKYARSGSSSAATTNPAATSNSTSAGNNTGYSSPPLLQPMTGGSVSNSSSSAGQFSAHQKQ